MGEFIDSFERAGITPEMAGKIRVLTHDEFALNRKERQFSKSLVIVDEAHMFTGIKYDALEKCDVPYIMLLSGTPAPMHRLKLFLALQRERAPVVQAKMGQRHHHAKRETKVLGRQRFHVQHRTGVQLPEATWNRLSTCHQLSRLQGFYEEREALAVAEREAR